MIFPLAEIHPSLSGDDPSNKASDLSLSSWDGAAVAPANPDFHFDVLLRRGLELEVAMEMDSNACHDGLFSLSPLSSPDPTPPSSPSLTPKSLPCMPDPDLDTMPSHYAVNLPNTKNAIPPPSSPTVRGAHTEDLNYYRKQLSVQKRHINQADAVKCPLPPLKCAKVAATGWVGLDDRKCIKQQFTLTELVGPDSEYGFTLQPWDGSTSMPIVFDKKIIGVLGGWPKDPTWATVAAEAVQALETRRSWCEIPLDLRVHRQGAFPALQCGVSHGGGQTRPMNLKNTPANHEIIEELNGLPCFQRIAGHTNSLMANWALDLRSYYATQLSLLRRHNPTLQQVFPSSVFAAATYNFGPSTVCFPHTDFANLPFGWCAVTALGAYNPRFGGHLVLWDCHLVIEFPPGATVLFLSAIITHSNTLILPGERRYSFAQYLAGGLFHWVENDFKTSLSFQAAMSQKAREEWEARNAGRWEFGMGLYSKVQAN